MHKVFISYHHENDQYYKNKLVELGERNSIFIDASVDTGDISDELSDERIRELIRDEYLRDSTVTIVLVGNETKRRKHVDWEIYSSMYNGTINKKSGILVLNLPTTSEFFTAGHGDEEKQYIYPDVKSWTSITSRKEYEDRYPYMPDRIIDNLLKSEAKISVAQWDKIENDPSKLKFLVDLAFQNRASCEYDLSQRMRRANS